ALESNNYQNAYVQQYNFFVEHKVGSWLLSVGYSGSKGSRLPVEYYLNGENSTLLAAPSVSGSNVVSCFHAGLNCSAFDSSTPSSPGVKGGYLQTGSD